MNKLNFFLLAIIIISCQNQEREAKNQTLDQNKVEKISESSKTPIMGWASWNSFRVNINEEIVMANADAMISSGLKDAGYTYVNIDDGYFGGRDEKANLLVHTERFPNGMKAIADYCHSKGLKAGIYTDAGINTCASF